MIHDMMYSITINVINSSTVT